MPDASIPVKLPPAPSKLKGPAWLNDLGYFDDDKSIFQRALIYGESGSGKTTFLGSWPRLLVIDTDKGGRTLRDKHIPCIPCLESRGIVDRVFAILTAAQARSKLELDDGRVLDFNEIDTIALDSFTAFSNSAIADMLFEIGKDPLKTKPSYDEYGKLLNIQTELGKRFKRLSLMYNIVVTALPDVNRDENTGTMYGGPLMVGSYRNVVMGDFDEVYYFTTEGSKDKVTYFMYSAKIQFFGAKTKLKIPYRVEDPTYDKLVAFDAKARA